MCKCSCCTSLTTECHQVMLFGPEGSGKTTLLYKLKCPGWDAHDLKRDMKSLRETRGNERPKDPGYHYEELSDNKIGRYGVWDVPGSDAFIRMWPMFYRYVNVSAVLYVVDASTQGIEGKEGENRVAQARRMMRFLLNEDELRLAAFFLILNVRQPDPAAPGSVGGPAVADGTSTKTSRDDDVNIYESVDTVKEMLAVSRIEDEPWNKIRFKSFAIDCSDISKTDVRWTSAIDDIYRVFLAIGHGSR